MKIFYFASLRERIGRSEEEFSPPEGVVTVADLIACLSARDEAYAAMFAEAIVKVAVDKKHVKFDAALAGAREVAFFPPMTGG